MHFMCPQNAHSMPDADAEGDYGDPSCKDYLTVYLKVQNNRENKVHCSNLSVSALRNAIKNYLNKNRTEDSYENSNSSR